MSSAETLDSVEIASKRLVTEGVAVLREFCPDMDVALGNDDPHAVMGREAFAFTLATTLMLVPDHKVAGKFIAAATVAAIAGGITMREIDVIRAALMQKAVPHGLS